MNDVYQAKQDNYLDCQRNKTQQRVITCLFVELVGALLDGLSIAEVACLQAEGLGHKTHHNNGILLRPKRQRHQDDFSCKGKKEDCRPPTAGQIVCGLNDK